MPRAEQTLIVGGMTCAACVTRVEKVLKRVPGVTSAEVDLMTGRATVHAADTVSPADLAAAITRAGYTAATAPLPPAPFWPVGGALALALPLAVSMLSEALGGPMLSVWVQAGMAACLQAAYGTRFALVGWKSIRMGAPSMDALVALGTWAAFLLSLYNLTGEMAGMMPVYFDSSALVIALVLLGRHLEGRARRQAGAALRDLARLQPARVTRERDGVAEDIDLAALSPGDLVRIRPGERVPTDGVVIEGHSDQDEAALTGESLPRTKLAGDAVMAGALNLSGLLLVRVERIGAETALGRTIRLVEAAQGRKPAVQKLADRISARFVPGVMLLAACTLAGWLLAGATAESAVINAVSVLVIACPCALGLATPAAIMAGTGVAARHGIVLRDPDVLSVAHRINTVVFDKTGTLTEGRPRLTACVPARGIAARDVLSLAAALQQGSLHPLARAVLADAPATQPAEAMQEFPGRGVGGIVGGRGYRLGNQRLLQEAGLSVGPLTAEATRLAEEGASVSFLFEISPTPHLLGLLGFADTPRPNAALAVAALRGRGVRCVLLSGDNTAAVASMAARLGFDEAVGGVLPAEKAARIAAWRGAGKVAMVGDGINDAPALAEADLGIAMAGGADLAAETAGIVLMRPDPTLVAAALDIAWRTERRIGLGLFWAFGFNMIGLPLAAAGRLSPALAGAAMAFSSLAVVLNALSLLRWKPRAS